MGDQGTPEDRSDRLPGPIRKFIDPEASSSTSPAEQVPEVAAREGAHSYDAPGAAAAAYTNTARYVTRPIAPLVAGATLRAALGAPFLIAGVLKSIYDLGLYLTFRTVAVEGERATEPGTAG